MPRYKDYVTIEITICGQRDTFKTLKFNNIPTDRITYQYGVKKNTNAQLFFIHVEDVEYIWPIDKILNIKIIKFKDED